MLNQDGREPINAARDEEVEVAFQAPVKSTHRASDGAAEPVGARGERMCEHAIG